MTGPSNRQHDVLPHEQRRSRRPLATEPLRRSRDERVIAGVCGGLASFVGASPRVVRLIWLVSLIPSIGTTTIAYFLLWWLVPLEQQG